MYGSCTGPASAARSPAPAQDLSIVFEDGTTLAVHLPSTEHCEHGAQFLVDADSGESWWLDEDHDGVAVEDILSFSAAAVSAHHRGIIAVRAM